MLLDGGSEVLLLILDIGGYLHGVSACDGQIRWSTCVTSQKTTRGRRSLSRTQSALADIAYTQPVSQPSPASLAGVSSSFADTAAFATDAPPLFSDPSMGGCTRCPSDPSGWSPHSPVTVGSADLPLCSQCRQNMRCRGLTRPSPTRSPLSADAWRSLLRAPASHSATAGDSGAERALCREVEWQWCGRYANRDEISGTSTSAAKDQWLHLTEAVAAWNRCVCPIHRVLLRDTKEDHVAELDLRSGELHWHHSGGSAVVTGGDTDEGEEIPADMETVTAPTCSLWLTLTSRTVTLSQASGRGATSRGRSPQTDPVVTPLRLCSTTVTSANLSATNEPPLVDERCPYHARCLSQSSSSSFADSSSSVSSVAAGRTVALLCSREGNPEKIISKGSSGLVWHFPDHSPVRQLCVVAACVCDLSTRPRLHSVCVAAALAGEEDHLLRLPATQSDQAEAAVYCAYASAGDFIADITSSTSSAPSSSASQVSSSPVSTGNDSDDNDSLEENMLAWWGAGITAGAATTHTQVRPSTASTRAAVDVVGEAETESESELVTTTDTNGHERRGATGHTVGGALMSGRITSMKLVTAAQSQGQGGSRGLPPSVTTPRVVTPVFSSDLSGGAGRATSGYSGYSSPSTPAGTSAGTSTAGGTTAGYGMSAAAADNPALPQPSQPSFFDDNFDPLLVLGKGATGVALLVRHRVTGAFYAVKVLLARDIDSERDILREVRLHAMLDHRHLVRYYGCWSEPVTPQRAQQLAFVGLVRQKEARLALAAAARVAPRRLSHPQRGIPTSRECYSGNGSLACSTGNEHEPSAATVSAEATPRVRRQVEGAAGWGNLRLALRTGDAAVALLGDESISASSYAEESLRGGQPVSVLSRVQRIRSSNSSGSSSSNRTHTSSSALSSDLHSGMGGESMEASSMRSPSTGSKHHKRQMRDAGALAACKTRPRAILASQVVFLQMELCQMTLAQHLAARSSIDRIENLVVALQLLEGLCYMHRGGVLHRDIKPTNVFLDYRCQIMLGRDSEDSECDESENDITDDQSKGEAAASHCVEPTEEHTTEETESILPLAANCTTLVSCPPQALGSEGAVAAYCLHGDGDSPFGSSHAALFPRGAGYDDARYAAYGTPTTTSRSPSSPRQHLHRQQTPLRGEELRSLQQEALRLLLNTTHHPSNELIARWLRMSGHGPHSQRDVRRLTRWLLRHLVQARLGDFGLAKAVAAAPESGTDRHAQRRRGWLHVSSTDGTHTIGVGSPLYASPEQLHGGINTSAASDAFSLGVVLAEMYVAPTTVSERLHVLREVREGRFPAKEDLAAYPELVVARRLTREPASRRIGLTEARTELMAALVSCVREHVTAAAH